VGTNGGLDSIKVGRHFVEIGLHHAQVDEERRCIDLAFVQSDFVFMNAHSQAITCVRALIMFEIEPTLD
jgi:hypothetical protein